MRFSWMHNLALCLCLIATALGVGASALGAVLCTHRDGDRCVEWTPCDHASTTPEQDRCPPGPCEDAPIKPDLVTGKSGVRDIIVPPVECGTAPAVEWVMPSGESITRLPAVCARGVERVRPVRVLILRL